MTNAPKSKLKSFMSGVGTVIAAVADNHTIEEIEKLDSEIKTLAERRAELNSRLPNDKKVPFPTYA